MGFITYPLTYLISFNQPCKQQCITCNNMRHVNRASFRDLHQNIRSTSCASTEFVYAQFALQSLYKSYADKVRPSEVHVCILTISVQTISTRPHGDTQVTMYNGNSTYIHTRTQPTDQADFFTIQSGFIACDLMVILLAAIASFPITMVPSGEITGSELIQKTHRTTLESLLQFELSNHNGRVRLPFFALCVCVYFWGNVCAACS